MFNIKSIAATLVSLVVLLASSGFTVYEHHCSKMNTTQVSVIVDLTECAHTMPEDFDHDHDTNDHACCSHHSDTEQGAPVVCEIEDINDDFENCCNTEKKYYKLIEKFDLQHFQNQIKLQFVPVLLAVIESQYLPLLPADFQQQIISDSGPPLLYGVHLINFIQQYKYHI